MAKHTKKRFFTPLRITGLLLFLLIIGALLGYLLLKDANIAVLNPQGIVAASKRI